MRSFRSTQQSHNIPTPLSTFIGCEPEIAEITRLFATHRLVTLTGAGGSGKTRLALKVAGAIVADFEHGLELNRLRGDKWGTGTMLGSLGWVALRQRDFRRMRELLCESLSIRTEISDKGGIAWCLEKLAEAKREESRFEEAAKILGCAEALRAPVGSVIDLADQPEYLRIISTLQVALGMEAFTALWAEGKTRPLDEVIESALSEPESIPTEKEKFDGLTAREREVAVLIAQGKSNREIAEAMIVGVKTVETYVTRILNKLGFDSRVQIATWAVQKGLASKINDEIIRT